MVYKWRNWLQFVLFPPTCRLCDLRGAGGLDLCADCRVDLPRLAAGCCRCALPLAHPAQGGLCGACLKTPPHFDTCVAPYLYRAPLDYLVLRLKFHRDLAMAELLGRLLAQHLECVPAPRPDLILPVPLHRTRLAERGFNQSLEIGRVLQRRLGLPLDYQLARRVRSTEPQTQLSAKARRKNMRKAFQVRAAAVPDHVAILDDVMTTGTTVNELARALKQAGAKRVDVWVVARAVRA